MKLNDDVKRLQQTLNEGGAQLDVDGIPGPKTILALKNQAFASVDPNPHPEIMAATSGFTRAKLATYSEALCKKQILRGSPGHKLIIADFKPIFGIGNWSWCAATVRYECKQVGLNIPLKCPSHFGYTFAFVEAWQQWAIEKGFYHDNDGHFQPEPGDIVIYDWHQTNINQPDRNTESHIGVHLRMSGRQYVAAEGNTGPGSRTNIRNRNAVSIQGWVRIPDGYKF